MKYHPCWWISYLFLAFQHLSWALKVPVSRCLLKLLGYLTGISNLSRSYLTDSWFLTCPPCKNKIIYPVLLSVSQFSWSVVSDSLWPHEPQHARPPCPSPTPRVHPNSCPLSRWCHPTISSSVVCPLLLLPSIFPSIRVFSNESALHIRWPKYWSFTFSISPSKEHPGLISFRMDWLDLLARDS